MKNFGSLNLIFFCFFTFFLCVLKMTTQLVAKARDDGRKLARVGDRAESGDRRHSMTFIRVCALNNDMSNRVNYRPK
jgi:hypothetical protein